MFYTDFKNFAKKIRSGDLIKVYFRVGPLAKKPHLSVKTFKVEIASHVLKRLAGTEPLLKIIDHRGETIQAFETKPKITSLNPAK